MAHNLEHKSHLFGASGSANHVRIIDEHIMSVNVNSIIVGPQAEESATVDALAYEILTSDLFNHELNFVTNTGEIDINARVTIMQEPVSRTGKKRMAWTAERTAPIWIDSDYSARIVPVSEATRGRNANLVTRNHHGSRIFHDDLTNASVLHGGAVGDLEFDSTSALRAIVARGSELRMLALKAILCLKQLSLAYTLGEHGEIRSAEVDIDVGHANMEDVAIAARTNRLLVDVAGFPDEYVSILLNLVRAWPFQGLYPTDDDTTNCIYTAVKVDADAAFVYTTGYYSSDILVKTFS
ncbi:uncharacterized protein LOC123988580 [Osmia bicornis bicornis]|uniref:uncharacterized protein LOC123988580 n=1 Tax=Osmia bicornis bicornis TaxID=1437191 RepID=UPI001EAF58E7|nr:uncharacterized protein LOC123988580 [Osmia bicornis bicornis]